MLELTFLILIEVSVVSVFGSFWSSAVNVQIKSTGAPTIAHLRTIFDIVSRL